MFNQKEIEEHAKLCKENKPKWGVGPWTNEPDRWQGVSHGFDVLAVRHPTHGQWCGYVGVPEGHPWYGKTDEELYQNLGESPVVHGGVTFTGKCYGHICHSPEGAVNESVWWLGFDCAHAYDHCPGTGEGIPPGECYYRPLTYVKNETNGLAEQAREAAEKTPPTVPKSL